MRLLCILGIRHRPAQYPVQDRRSSRGLSDLSNCRSPSPDPSQAPDRGDGRQSPASSCVRTPGLQKWPCHPRNTHSSAPKTHLSKNLTRLASRRINASCSKILAIGPIANRPIFARAICGPGIQKRWSVSVVRNGFAACPSLVPPTPHRSAAFGADRTASGERPPLPLRCRALRAPNLLRASLKRLAHRPDARRGWTLSSITSVRCLAGDRRRASQKG